MCSPGKVLNGQSAQWVERSPGRVLAARLTRSPTGGLFLCASPTWRNLRWAPFSISHEHAAFGHRPSRAYRGCGIQTREWFPCHGGGPGRSVWSVGTTMKLSRGTRRRDIAEAISPRNHPSDMRSAMRNASQPATSVVSERIETTKCDPPGPATTDSKTKSRTLASGHADTASDNV